jgi:hypothetical protein
VGTAAIPARTKPTGAREEVPPTVGAPPTSAEKNNRLGRSERSRRAAGKEHGRMGMEGGWTAGAAGQSRTRRRGDGGRAECRVT